MKRQFLYVVAAAVSTTLAVVYLLSFHSSYSFRSSLIQNSFPIRRPSKITFPNNFPVDIDRDALLKNEPAFSGNYVFTEANSRVTPFLVDQTKWKPMPLKVFNSRTTPVAENMCGAIENEHVEVDVSEKISLMTPLEDVLSDILQETLEGNNTYLNELAPYFLEKLKLQLKFGVGHLYWFRMSGSSVYLKEYGVHLVTSRLAYAPSGKRTKGIFSLVYAQLYSREWAPLKSEHLVVPSNTHDGNDSFAANGRNYTIAKYPTVVPIPYFHNYEDPEKKFLGPEDPRIVLVKNKLGHEEPLLVFNAKNNRLRQVSGEDEEPKYEYREHRAMFMGWLWQRQVGKTDIGPKSDEFESTTYTRITELLIEGLPREGTQKNWTPMLSEVSRSEHGYDKYVNFIPRWSDLAVIQCEIESSDGLCSVIYKRKEDSLTSGVGPFRGGTDMINLQHVLQRFPEATKDVIIPENREVFLGFARAHLLGCGCGKAIYRPNMVVIVKDSVPEAESGDFYRVAHVSSFISLHVDIIGWNPERPSELCEELNVLIPNGISDWEFSVVDDTSSDNSTQVWQDTLTLSFSIADIDNNVLQINGLFKVLQSFGDDLLISKNGDTPRSNKPTDILDGKPLSEHGFNNDNIDCALEASKHFCATYGNWVKDTIDMEGTLVPHNEQVQQHNDAYKDAVEAMKGSG